MITNHVWDVLRVFSDTYVQTIAMENNNFSTDMNQSAFDLHDFGECFKYPHHRCASHQKDSELLAKLDILKF